MKPQQITIHPRIESVSKQHAVSLSSLEHYLLDLDLCQLHITILAIQLQVNSHRWFVRLDQISSLLWFFPSILRSLKG